MRISKIVVSGGVRDGGFKRITDICARPSGSVAVEFKAEGRNRWSDLGTHQMIISQWELERINQAVAEFTDG